MIDIQVVVDNYSNNKYSKNLLLNIWDEIKKKLKDKYRFIEKDIKLYDYNNIISDINKNKYDLAIGNFNVNVNKLKYVNFTVPLLFNKPVIIYKPSSENTDHLKYFKYLFNVWKIPILLLFFLLLFIYILISLKGKYSILDNIYYAFGILMGKTSIHHNSNIKNIKHLMLNISIYLIAYFVVIYITAISAAKSVPYLSDINSLEYSIKDKEILVPRQSRISSVIKKNGGIPIYYNDEKYDIDPYTYFIERKEKDDTISGFMYYGFNKINEKAKKYNLKVSKLSLGNYRVSFPVNKKKTKLLSDINDVINQIYQNGTIYNLCKLWSDNDLLMC